MKRSLITKGLIAILIVFIFGLSVVGCTPPNTDNGNDGGGEVISVDKSGLLAELALEVTERNDFTQASFDAYLTKLGEAKAVADDESATQDQVDTATAELSAARLALVLKPIEEVEGGKRSFVLLPGESVEIALADYVNAGSLSKITYKAKASNAVVSLSPITDGKFTITAGEINKKTDLTVSIIVCYDGAEKLKVDLAVQISDEIPPTAVSAEIVKEYDILQLSNKDSIVIDFAEYINNPAGLDVAYSVKLDGEDLVLDGTSYTFLLGSYTEEYVYTVFDVAASFIHNGEHKVIEYTYKLGLRDTATYNVVNGGFENGLDGWTFVNTLGDAPFGGIDHKTHYWVQNFPMFNVGSYFSAYADGAAEGSQGYLASSYFVVNSDYATFMLAGAGNHNVYITIENESGEVLALYRNTKFQDLPEGLTDFDAQRELIGESVFLCNFVTYKADLSAWAGEKVRFVIHDYASEGWGVVFFDELNTYHTTEPDGVLAENLLADKSALNAELALEVTEQGDFTLDSYNAYLAKLDAAKELVDDIAVTQADVDAATAALTDARLALAVRLPFEVDGANKSFRLASDNGKEIALADYININGLSNITYTLTSKSGLVTFGEIVDGKFTVTAGKVDDATVESVYIVVNYNGEAKLTVELSVQITNDVDPSVFNAEVGKSLDLYYLDNKADITLDLSENIDNAGNLALSFSVNGKAISGSSYTFTFGKYGDVATDELLNITVSYTANGDEKSISYTYKLSLCDTTDYRLYNGGFENGLEGWNKVGDIGDASSNGEYWKGPFGMDGEKMFSAYEPVDLERNVGTLTSSTFKVGGTGFVTFKIGAMRDENYVYIDVVDAETKQILARYYNGLWEGTDCTLVAYKADLSAFMGKEVFFRISDNADSGYGLFFADSFETYYESEPDDSFNAATPVSYEVSGTIYDLFNGSFEMGNVQGWWSNGEIGVVTNANGYWGDNIPYEKVGDFLFTGVESFGADTMREGNKGTLTSSAFLLGGSGFISFKLGGGGNELCYVQIIDAVTGELLARYHQQAQQDAKLIQYTADLSAYIGRTVRIQVVDYAENGWGCVSFDNVVTYHESKPEGIDAIDIKGDLKYTIDNGSFENGLEGWHQNIWEAGAHNTLGWVQSEEIDAGWYTKNDDTKDGDYLFTFVQLDDTNCENSKGTLESSTFSLKQGSFVSFKFGGAGGGRNHDVYIELCRQDGSVIARFFNDAEGKINTRMNSYFYQYNGAEVNCFFRVVDNSTGDYGCFVVDDFRVNLESAPEGYIPAIQ